MEQCTCPQLDGIARAQAPSLIGGQDGVMTAVVDGFCNVPTIYCARYPKLRIETPEIYWPRIASERFVRAPYIFVKIRHHEFAKRAVDRVPPSKPDVIALRDRAPASTASKQDKDVIVVTICLQVHHQRWLALNPQGARGDEGSLNAVSVVVPERLGDGEARITRPLEVCWKGYDKVLNGLGCLEMCETLRVRA